MRHTPHQRGNQRETQARGSDGRRAWVLLAMAGLALGPTFGVLHTAAAAAPAQPEPDVQPQAGADQPDQPDQVQPVQVSPDPAPQDPSQPDQARPVAGNASGAPGATSSAAAGDDEVVLSAFSEPVELSALVDFVAKTLGINVTVKGALTGSVVFNAPVKVSRDRLLPLLDALLGQQNFTITLDPSGFYTVQPLQDVVMNFGEGATTRIISTPNIRPTALKPAIDAQFPSQGSSRQFAYVDELGVIVATDTPRRLDALEGLVSAILAERRKLRWEQLPLTYVAAPVARQRVLEIIGHTSPRTGIQTFPGQPAVEQAVLDPSALTGQPGVTGRLSNLADRLIVAAQGNALIFRGMPDEADQVRELLSIIDVPSTLVPKSYFAGTAARQLADIARQRGLGEVITIGDSTANQNRFNPYGAEFNFPQGGLNQQQQTQTGGPVMVVDEARGLIIYYGTTEQQDQLQALIRELDTEADRVVVEVYKLKHTSAEVVAELVNGLLTNTAPAGDSPLVGGTGTGFAGSRRGRNQIQPPTSGNVTVIQTPDIAGQSESGLTFSGGDDVFAYPDTSNNQILIKAPAKQQPEFARLIDKIDLRRPQVYIDCQIIALTATDDFRLAFETQLLQDGGDAVLNTNFGLSSFGTAPFDSRKTVSTSLTGLTAAIIKSENVPLIINALQTVADTQILSSPSLLVDDNEEASIASVQQQPTTSTSQGTSTTETSFAGYEDAGTNLTIQPQISEGGYLRLKYEAKLSNFTGTGSNGIPAPRNENTVSAESVTVPSDMTVVVGGLTLDSKSRTVVKVPLLGDIPVIGALFRDDNRNDRKTTLYIFLTPRILRDPNFADLRLLTKGPQARSEISDVIPDMSPAVMPVIAPGANAPRPADRPLPADPSAPDMTPATLPPNEPPRVGRAGSSPRP